MDLVKLSSEELHLTFAGFLAEEIGQDGCAALLRRDAVSDAVNRAFTGEPPPERPVTNGHGYALFLLPLVMTGRLDPQRALEAVGKVEAEFECYATLSLKACADRLTTKAASILGCLCVMTYATALHRQLDRMLDRALDHDGAHDAGLRHPLGPRARMFHALLPSRLRGADARGLTGGRWRCVVKGGRILWICPHGRADSTRCPDCRR